MLRSLAVFRRAVPLYGFQPLADRVLVRKDAATRETSAGLILSKEEKVIQATVIAVGPGKVDAPLTVKNGDRVLLPEWGGQRVKIDGEENFLFRESEILGVIV